MGVPGHVSSPARSFATASGPGRGRVAGPSAGCVPGTGRVLPRRRAYRPGRQRPDRRGGERHRERRGGYLRDRRGGQQREWHGGERRQRRGRHLGGRRGWQGWCWRDRRGRDDRRGGHDGSRRRAGARGHDGSCRGGGARGRDGNGRHGWPRRSDGKRRARRHHGRRWRTRGRGTGTAGTTGAGGNTCPSGGRLDCTTAGVAGAADRRAGRRLLGRAVEQHDVAVVRRARPRRRPVVFRGHAVDSDGGRRHDGAQSAARLHGRRGQLRRRPHQLRLVRRREQLQRHPVHGVGQRRQPHGLHLAGATSDAESAPDHAEPDGRNVQRDDNDL